ncbi:MAG: GNAT family N-acetyltransferase [Clostridia bacterium]|nr:GNAT family N-acetyltransferase [Clostridia bacterium]
MAVLGTIETEIGKIEIREAKVKDASSTVEFMNWVTGEVDYHTYGANDFNIRPEDEARMIEMFHSRDNCLFLIATFSGQIVAVATLTGGVKERVKHRGTIGITVAKRFWRLGIGQQMMRIIINYAEKSPVLTKLELLVHEENIPAIKLYNKLGFFREGTIQRYFRFEETYYDGINMGLIVD